MSQTPYRQVPCPQCGTLSEWRPENKWRPFCCERCKLIDLGSWADESYKVPVQEPDQGSIDSPDQNG